MAKKTLAVNQDKKAIRDNEQTDIANMDAIIANTGNFTRPEGRQIARAIKRLYKRLRQLS